jgi:hypothetical protein
MHPDRRPRPATGNLKEGSTGTLLRTSWPQDFTPARYRGYAASFWRNEAASRGGVTSGSALNKRESAPSFEHRQLDHRPQPSSMQAVRATTRSDVSSAVLQCRSIQTSPDARPRAMPRCSRHAGSEISTSVPVRMTGSSQARALVKCVSSFWIVGTMRCNCVVASSTCHRHGQPIRLHSLHNRGSALYRLNREKAGFDGGAEPQGGGNSEASRQVQIGMHGPETNTINLMDKEEDFCRPGGAYRRRRKPKLPDPCLSSLFTTSAQPVEEAATSNLLVLPALAFRVPTLPPAQQACEYVGLASSRYFHQHLR